MTALRATFHFEINELLAQLALFGTSHELKRGHYHMRVVFPTEAGQQKRNEDLTWRELDAHFPAREQFPPLEAFERRRTSLTIDTTGEPAATIIRVQCFFDGSFGAADFEGLEGVRDAPALSEAADALREAGDAAREGVRALLDWIRVRGQHWLGPDAGSPRGLAYGELVDLDAGRTLPTRIKLDLALHIRRIGPHQILDATQLAEALRLLDEGLAPPLEDALRADALYLLQDAEPPDFARAVVTAAIACEVKIKRTLRHHAATGREEDLVELLLSNPRDWSLALLALFDRPLAILTDASLRQSDRPLYRRLDALIQRRNGLAHKEQDPPDKDEATDHVRTAVDVFRWLDSIRPTTREREGPAHPEP